MQQSHSLLQNRSGLADWLASSRSAIAAIWLVYVGLRLAILWVEVAPTSDALWYYDRAVMLADGRGYLGDYGQPTAFWPVGWPMVMSFVFRLTGPSVLAIGLFNLVCAVVAGWFTYDLGRRIFGSELAGRMALLLLAIYPNAIGYVPLLLTEVFYTALLLGGCWLLVTRNSLLSVLAAGVVFGISMLVKAQSLAVIPLIMGIALLRQPGFWRHLPDRWGAWRCSCPWLPSP